MAFKGKTTAGYKSTTGTFLRPAKKGGVNPRNVASTARVLPGSKTNIVTKQTKTGANPKNSPMNKLSANRIQKAGKAGSGQTQVGVGKAAKIVSPASRGVNSLNKNPFGGYQQLRNTKGVPAGKGNIRNSVTRTDVSRLRTATRHDMPKTAVQGGKTFKSFLG